MKNGNLEKFIFLLAVSPTPVMVPFNEMNGGRELQSTPNLRIASFFSGIGGFDLAFEQASCEIVFQCERDKFCRQVLHKHWPELECHPDIDQVASQDIPQAQVWCGGFPCQDLSLANQGKRQGLEGKRSGLFTKFAELACASKPKWLVIENVPGLLNSGDGQDSKYVIQTLDDIGYFVAWRILDAKYFGTPQRRRRVFLVASYQSDSAARVLFDDGLSYQMAPPGKLSVNTTSQFSRSGYQGSDLFAIQHATIGRKPEAGPQAKGWRNDGKPTLSIQEAAPTLFVRRMMASEYEILQGFPANWTRVD